jgi:tetratricopeptide (TPR) repeat protein
LVGLLESLFRLREFSKMPPDNNQSEVLPSPEQLPSPVSENLKAPVRMKRSLKAHIESRTFAELLFVVKVLIVGLVTIVPALLTVFVVSKAMVETGLVMTALRVPQSLDALGYTSETSTQRLLDEISALNKTSRAAKPKTAVGDTQLVDALSSVETPSGNLDLKSLQSLIQRALGKTIIQISGEITARKEDGRDFLRLRLRQTPGREVLIDFETSRGIEDLFKKAALNLLEHVDPVIAAGIYFRVLDDSENAMRLTAIALAGEHPGTEKYALNLQSYIFLRRGQLDDAMRASDKARSLDSLFWPADISKARILMALKRFDEALEVAKHGVDLDPGFQSYKNLGATLSAMGRKDDAVEAFHMALRLNKRDVGSYIELAAVFRDEGRTKDASDTLFTAVAVVPESAWLQYSYGEDLKSQGRPHVAFIALCKAYEMQPDNILFQIACAEAEFSEGLNADGTALATIVQTRINSDINVPAKIKQRAAKLAAQIPAIGLPPATASASAPSK